MMARALSCLLMATLVLLSSTSRAQTIAPETPEEHDARMQWWRDARFGMFVHWGLYAIPAGEWNGKETPDIGEWIMSHANIPVPEYEQLAPRFNPTEYDPAEWVRIAKDAGVKYIVITSKHHDGFCLFDTQATDWDVVDATPYGKDLLQPLAAECRKQGIKFCTYYSIMDWHHPSQMRGSKDAYDPTRMKPGRKEEYIDYMRTQLTELINKVDPEVLWFDGEWPEWWQEEDGQELYAFLRRLKPQLIINNRVGKGRKGMEGLNKDDREYVGDFGTPEQQIPATGAPGVDWESCMTMNDTWGFKKNDHNWKSAETLIRNLVDVASKGGNYLLNVGPTAEGRIPDASIERLKAIGKWMHVNSESIYGTSASPFESLPWGRCTRRIADDQTTLYLHVFDWPENGRLVVPIRGGGVASASLLDGGDRLEFATTDEGVSIELPDSAPDQVDSVIKVQISGDFRPL